ncbi:hypothetical protein WKW79_31345 [Variovorax robiniae]|uniref:Uncharacterized protein n=1 Tax=Variovorax robiniae TaxID=1836199 RepID=A0ABU8XJ62_9BURK
MRVRNKVLALATVTVAALAGCGGGSGGGGGFLPVTPVPVQPPAPAESKVTLTVTVAGNAASPDASGNYTVAPGRNITVMASEAVEWSGSSTGDAVVTRHEISTIPTAWASRLANASKTQPGSYTLVARTADGLSKPLKFVVAAGDYRSGDYKVFGADGSRQSLTVDFDQRTFTMTDSNGVEATGALGAEDSGWFSVISDRVTGINTSVLRPFDDTILGAFPYAVPYANPVTYASYPLVASRALVTTQASLDGTYNRFRVDASPTGRDSRIGQVQISAGGTLMKQCTDNIIYRVDECPPASLVSSTVAADAESGMWSLADTATSTFQGRFAIARMGGENVYLSAGPSPSGSSQVFSIGLPETPAYTGFKSSAGGSTRHTLDVSSATATDYSYAPLGSASATQFALGGVGPSAPYGMRVAGNGPDRYFFMRSARLEAVVGSRGNANTQGFLHLGLILD